MIVTGATSQNSQNWKKEKKKTKKDTVLTSECGSLRILE
jgi:hypothetical protein